MKLLICSDIHGDAQCLTEILEAYKREAAEKLLILGDLLYHGPRNDLPSGYNPKKVIALLNENKDSILTVKGNCDGEVDQMVLSFPILADYAFINIDNFRMFMTHGHHHNTENLPPLSKGDILLHGHTHMPAYEPFGNENVYINPGSVSIPKNNFPKTYSLYENGVFALKTLDGKILWKNGVPVSEN